MTIKRKMKKQTTNKLLCLLLAALLLAGQVLPALALNQEGGTITIATAEDLKELAVQCTLDSWSQGKTVVLTDDINLSGSGFTPIPTFGGTFDGQGHTISGLTITGSGNTRGLFRYVQQGAVVQNLTVKASIGPSDRKNEVAAIAGSNSGIIRQCAAQGGVKGGDSVGGVVGVNELTGQVINCTFSGSVTGEHYVGGIAGRNLGSLIQCRNSGSVNTTEVETEKDLTNVDWEQLNSAENMPASTDIGGIAGWSSGILQSCSNSGPVGYAHVGYNIGGVVGRQSGYLDGCSNSGPILGRKDVGGVAGQLEPQLTLKYDEDTLNKLWDELDNLQDLMDSTLNHTGTTVDAVSQQITDFTDSARTAKDAVHDLTDAMTDWGNDNIDQVNDAFARISWTLDQMSPILDTISQSVDRMSKASSQLADAMDSMREVNDALDDAADNMDDARDDMDDAHKKAQDALDSIQDALADLKKAVGSDAETAAALAKLATGMTQLSQALADVSVTMGTMLQIILDAYVEDGGMTEEAYDALQEQVRQTMAELDSAKGALDNMSGAVKALTNHLLKNLRNAISDMDDAMGYLKDAGDYLSQAGSHFADALADLQKAHDPLDDALSSLSDAGDTLSAGLDLLKQALDDGKRVVDELAAKPTIQFQIIGDDLTQKGDAVDDAFSDLLDNAGSMNDMLSDRSDIAIADLRAINDQLRVIIDLIRDAIDEERDKDLDDYFEDISDQDGDGKPDAGLISACQNSGSVEGDVNVGGIAGSMAVEYDFDPEDDLTKVGDKSLDFRYLARAVMLDCVNRGEITGKKNYTGGVVGLMDLGRVSGCQGYGPVSSSDGDYVGGVAGASYGFIRDSWARCQLSGKDYVGGVAGYGSTIENSRSFIEIDKGEAYVGAIAGDMEEDGTLTGNLFVHDTLGGLDGISYTGKAQPTTFDELSALGNAPGEFTQFQLTFMADGKQVAVIPFQYGQGIERLPDIPAKKGYSAQWPDLDYGHLTFSRTLEAEYTPYSSVITDGSGLPEILVDGSFSRNAKVEHTTADVTWTDESGKEHTGTAYTVTVTDPVLDDVSYTVHYRLPDRSQRYALWVETKEGWQRQSLTVDGSYAMIPCQERKITFCVQEEGPAWLIWAVAGGGAVVLLGGAALLLRRKHKKQRAQVQKAQPPDQTPVGK